MIGLDRWDWYQSKILDVGTKVLPAPLVSIDWVLSRLFSSHGTSKNWNLTILQILTSERLFLQIQKVFGSKVCVESIPRSWCISTLLSAACLLSSSAVCCCCPSVVVLSWSVSLFQAQTSSICWWPRWPPTHWWHRWLVAAIPTLRTDSAHMAMQYTNHPSV